MTACGLAAAALVVCRPRAGSGVSGDDPTAGVVTVAAWAAWLLALYLVAAVVATAAARLPRSPRAAQALARRITPAVVRRMTDAAIGVTTAAVVLAGPPVTAYADPSPAATAAAAVPTVEWPGLPAAAHSAAASATTPAVGLVTPPPRRAAAAGDATVVVRAGDTLWSLAARQLGASATDAQVARAWPQLYAANRAVIGANPDLIRPGQRLVCPPLDPRSQP
jgi:nucleoid-associated protein YgaU